MLHLHRAERADVLVDALADLLREPLADPMTAEMVAVPTKGVERWIIQRLATRLGVGPDRSDGVCANVEFPFPGTLVLRATAAATGVDPDADPWRPERAVWPLVEVVDRALAEPWLAPLAHHIQALTPEGGEGPRRFAAIRHLADLFDRYSVHRPEMVRAWAAGQLDASPHDGGGLWQARLWRLLRDRIATPSPAERLPAATDALSRDPTLVDLPARLSLFGLTRLPPSYVAVLDALAAGRELHLFLLHPSNTLWQAVSQMAPWPIAPPRREDPTAALPAHPLLASWGRDAREMQLVLTAGRAPSDDYRPGPDGPATLLGRIQADIKANRAPAGRPGAGQQDRRPALDASDLSLQIHSCHGRGRQVEVVRDAIMHLLDADPTLEPRDIIIMCPDIEVFAPLIHAAFGAGEATDRGGGGLPDIQVRLADRSLRQTNPMLAVAAHLLEMATSRVTATDVLDLAGRDPVRRRFGFDEEDLAQIQSWLAGTGIRWGLDAAHRANWGLGGLASNTWEAGLDRLLLGVAMAEEDQRLVGSVLPLDDVSSNSVELAGRLAEMVERLATGLRALGGTQPLAAWTEALRDAVESIGAVPRRDGWQRDQLHRVLDEVRDEAAHSDVELSTAEVRALLADRLRGRPTRANFRTGHLTICTLVPMRSVPHRVVCLLGLDDGAFPRNAARDGDDLTLAEPQVGDRDPRSEDRQLLLDALLAATDHLVIAYAGRDVRTNQPRPPAVPVAELLDVADRTVHCFDGAGQPVEARRRLVVEHPLQPFDPRNFTAGELWPGRSWSFDPIGLEGARAMVAPRPEARQFLARRLPARTDPVIELASLVRFVEHPVRAFLRERLGVYVRGRDDDVEDDLPVELAGLQKWGVGDRWLRAVLAGGDMERCEAAERARGLLPPGALADGVVAEVRGKVVEVAAVTNRQPPPGTHPTSLDVHLPLPDGRVVVGTVANVWGHLVLTAHYSRLGAKHRLASWVRFLALSACWPELPVQARVVAQAEVGSGAMVASLGPLAGDADARRAGAITRLQAVVDLYDRGMREPLPLYCKTSAAYARACLDAAGGDPRDAARREWEHRLFGEQLEAEHRLIYGGPRTLDDLEQMPAADDEVGDGWDEAEPGRFARLALRLWSDLLSLETVTGDG